MAAAAVVKSPTNPEVNHNPLTSPISEVTLTMFPHLEFIITLNFRDHSKLFIPTMCQLRWRNIYNFLISIKTEI